MKRLCQVVVVLFLVFVGARTLMVAGVVRVLYLGMTDGRTGQSDVTGERGKEAL